MRRAMPEEPEEEAKPKRAARGIPEAEPEKSQELPADSGEEFADEMEITMVRRMALNLDDPVPIAKPPSFSDPARAIRSEPTQPDREPLDKKWLAICGAIPVGVLLFGLVVALVGAVSPRDPAKVAAASGLSRTCTPMVGVDSQLFAVANEGEIELRELAADEPQTVSNPYQGPITKPARLSTVNKTASASGGIYGAVDEHSYWSQCVSPLTDSVAIAPGTEGTTLVLYNPDNEPVYVDITISTSSGQADAPDLRGMQIGGYSTQLIKLSDYATDEEQAGVRVRTITGRLGVSIASKTETGMSVSSASRLSKKILIPGAPAGADTSRLVVTNPDTTRKELTVRVVDAEGTKTVEEKLVAEAQRTQSFDLKKYLDKGAAIEITSDYEIAASLISSAGSDLAVSQGSDDYGSDHLIGTAATAGNLLLANLTDQDTTAHVSWDGEETADIQLKAGTSTSIAVPSGKKNLEVRAEQQIAGAIFLTETGISVANLSHFAQPKNIEVLPEPGVARG